MKSAKGEEARLHHGVDAVFNFPGNNHAEPPTSLRLPSWALLVDVHDKLEQEVREAKSSPGINATLPRAEKCLMADSIEQQSESLCQCQWLDGRHTILSPNSSSTSSSRSNNHPRPHSLSSSSNSNTKPSTPSPHPHLSPSPTVPIPPPEKTPMRRSTIWLAAGLWLASHQLPSNSGPMATPWQWVTW